MATLDGKNASRTGLGGLRKASVAVLEFPGNRVSRKGEGFGEGGGGRAIFSAVLGGFGALFFDKSV